MHVCGVGVLCRGPESGLMHMPISHLLLSQSTLASALWKANEPGNMCAFTTCQQRCCLSTMWVCSVILGQPLKHDNL